MSPNQGLTALEVLGVAIRSESEAASFYAHLAARVHNPILADKLNFLRKEEEKHRVLLESLYARRFPDIELKLPTASLLPSLETPAPGDLAVPALFQIAMKAEQASADFYSREADRSNDPAGKEMLRYLANVERSHYHLLETEYDLVSRFPDYYDADKFHFGDELVHIGP